MELFGIFEYDTPVTINPGGMLTGGMSTQFEPEIALP